MPHDFWAEAHDPLEMLVALNPAPSRYSTAQRDRHDDLLNTYTLRCLRSVGADFGADLFRDSAFGYSGSPDRLHYDIIDLTKHLSDVAGTRGGGSYSAGRRPRHIPPYVQQARAVLAAFRGHTAWQTAVEVTLETKHLLQREQCGWLRCLFANPLADPSIRPEWLTATVASLTRAIVAENAFEHLPILADALQDAGCDDEHLLHHCRHAEYHGQHCWAVCALAEASGFTAWHWVTVPGT